MKKYTAVLVLIILLSSITVYAAPTQPYSRWGKANFEIFPLPDGINISAYIDGVVYGKNRTFYGDGSYSIDVKSMSIDKEYKDGGLDGDLIIYVLEGEKKLIANEADIFKSGIVFGANLTFSEKNQPKWLKINELVIEPDEGNDYVFIYNPTDNETDLSNWRFEDNDDWFMNLEGKIGSKEILYFDLGGDVLNNVGDELKISWYSGNTSIANGNSWVVMDRVEYGVQTEVGDDTILQNFLNIPGKGQSLGRIFDGYDTDNCTNDFKIKNATKRPMKETKGNVAGFVKDGNYLPIKDAQISIIEYYSNTASDGSYFIKDIPEGIYDISASKEGYITEIKKVFVKGNETVYINFTLNIIKRYGNITGVVSDESEKTLSNCYIEVLGTLRTAITNENGVYFIGNISIGNYSIRATKPGYKDEKKDVYISEGTNKFDFILRRNETKVGKIFGKVIDENGKGIEGVKVSVGGYITITNSTGEFIIEKIPIGEYKLKLEKKGYKKIEKEIVVSPDSALTLDFSLEPIKKIEERYEWLIIIIPGIAICCLLGGLLIGREMRKKKGSISGIVTNVKGDGIEGVSITLGGTRLSARTDKIGQYTIKNVKEGKYNITAMKSGYWYDDKVDIFVHSGKTKIVDFKLTEKPSGIFVDYDRLQKPVIAPSDEEIKKMYYKAAYETRVYEKAEIPSVGEVGEFPSYAPPEVKKMLTKPIVLREISMEKCPTCGEAVDESWETCPYCSTSLPKIVPIEEIAAVKDPKKQMAGEKIAEAEEAIKVIKEKGLVYDVPERLLIVAKSYFARGKNFEKAIQYANKAKKTADEIKERADEK
ncbi:MAG: carboxypeptidase regulatory-like domain-containing protein [Candidatus Thermoplasmatota archaeon]